MILCVTLNPCLDKTLTVPAWKPGDLVRGFSVREVVGGKGNNVARALKRLGRVSRPMTFLGGTVGKHCEELLHRDDGMEPVVITSKAPTREILTVRTEGSVDQTAFFDPDPIIRSSEVEAFLERTESLLREGGIGAITLSGSSPAPATHGVYSDLISQGRARRIPVFLDTYGPALDGIWGFWPTVMQLNRREAAGRLRKPSATDRDVLDLLDDWNRHGVTLGLVTDGPNPVLIQCREQRYRATPPAIEPINPIGSGDSLLAGLVDGWLSGLDTEPLIRHAVGCAVANALVWDAGAIEVEEVNRLQNEVILEPVN